MLFRSLGALIVRLYPPRDGRTQEGSAPTNPAAVRYLPNHTRRAPGGQHKRVRGGRTSPETIYRAATLLDHEGRAQIGLDFFRKQLGYLEF